MVTDETFDIKKFATDLMNAEGLSVAKKTQPLRMHSHCAGIDAPVWGLRLLGVPLKLLLASELDPAPALVHLTHHKAEHLFMDVAYAAHGTG